MFTGLILGTGTVRAAQPASGQSRLTIAPDFPLDDYRKGESIAVSGACLTVESFGPGWFAVYASSETLDKTTLGGLKPGSKVNLERALALGERLGGHLVSGHVDGVARVRDSAAAGQSRLFTLEFPKEFAELIAPKGSVALDGVSLTVNQCGEDWLSVNIIPETLTVTTVGSWKKGAAVNLETDLLGKYVRRMVAPWLNTGRKGGVSEDFLREHGF